MSALRVNITMSVDGYVAGPHQSLDQPLGIGGETLHNWMVNTRTFHQLHGQDGGGETGPDDSIAAEMFENVGATIMGRHMFGGGEGAWSDWKGWWGENPPYHSPVFVLTHHPREPLGMQGGTTFHFVTEGIHTALERARDAAAGKDVHIGGGAEVVQQYLKTGLIDEMDLHISPLLLGSGARLFDETGGRQTEFECIRVISTPAARHYKYRRNVTR